MKRFNSFAPITKAIIALTLLLISGLPVSASTVISITEGKWSDPSTWRNQVVPRSTDSIVVNTNVYYDLDVVIDSGGSITINDGDTLCLQNSLDILCGGYITCNGILNVGVARITDGEVNGRGRIYVRSYLRITPCKIGFKNNNYVIVGLFSSCFSASNPAVEKFNIYPNPFTQTLNVSSQENDNLDISFYDICSRKCLERKFTKSISLNTASLPLGVYFYIIKNKNTVIKKGTVFKE